MGTRQGEGLAQGWQSKGPLWSVVLNYMYVPLVLIIQIPIQVRVYQVGP